MPKVIDIHTHFFPKENLEAILRNFGEDYWLSLLFPAQGKTLQSFPSQAEFIAAMDEAGIAKSVINGAYWQSLEACKHFNKSALDFAKNYPDRILPMAIISPNFVDESIAFLRKAKNLGFIGVGELCDSVQGFDVLSEGFLEITKTCQEECLPMCFHLSDELGKDYNGKIHTKNDALFELTRRFPACTFIFSHLAGGRAFRGANMPSNVYMDTAAFSLLYKKEFWGKLDFEKEQNICFATDYSLNLYPKAQERADFLRLKQQAEESIAPKHHQDFFQLNAKRLFGL